MSSRPAASLRTEPVAQIDIWHPTGFEGVILYHGRNVTQAYPRHWHEELHVCAYTSGAGWFGYRGSSYQISPGDFLITPAGEVHENCVASEAGISFRSMYIPVPLIQGLAHQITGKAATMPQFSQVLPQTPDVKESFIGLHRAMQDHESGLSVEALWTDFLSRLITRCSASAVVGRRTTGERLAVRRARDYIHDHFPESIALADLANVAQLSPFHLHHVFCDETGMPPHAYQTQIRINRAKELLIGGWRLSDIAVATGFADQSHLTRHFRRLVGTTPGRFFCDRKNVQDTSFLLS